MPLALLDAGFEGKTIMLEPRRLAARAAAERLAEQLGEAPGQTVGYRMRGDSKAGSRIEVVTEGILTRMLQSDAELTGVGTVIFDEFHERSLVSDLGLALTWEVRNALRDDLNIVVMSATGCGAGGKTLERRPDHASGRAFQWKRDGLKTTDKSENGPGLCTSGRSVSQVRNARHPGVLAGCWEIERVGALQGSHPIALCNRFMGHATENSKAIRR